MRQKKGTIILSRVEAGGRYSLGAEFIDIPENIEKIYGPILEKYGIWMQNNT